MQSASTTTTPTRNEYGCFCEPGCSVCEKPCYIHRMCRECDVKRLREQFPNWTSGSKEIDAIIQKSQEAANYYVDCWEWIEPSQFKDIKHLADGGFSSVYTATWIDGYRIIDDDDGYEIRTRIPNTVVVLKVANVLDWSGNNSNNNVTAEFLNEVGNFKSIDTT